MDLQHYHEFKRLQAEGRKHDARASLERFIPSFEPGEDRTQWVREFLGSGDYGHKIRHELYQGLIFPVLLDGYHRRDAWSILWLARTAQNLYAFAPLHALIGFKSEQELLREAYQIDPNEEIRDSLLRTLLNWFAYCQHEWPTGILFGADGASAAECDEILEEVSFARTLDVGAANEPFLREFEQRTREYRQRLQKPQ